MKINTTNRYDVYAPLLRTLKKAQLEQATKQCIERRFGNGGLWSTTLGAMIAYTQRDVSQLTEGRAMNELQVSDYLILTAYKSFLAEFATAMESIKVPMTKNEQKAMSKLPKVENAETLLCFTREYFGLKNFDEAAKIPLSDIVVARRDTATKKLYMMSQL